MHQPDAGRAQRATRRTSPAIVRFLAGDEAGFITGETIYVDGGMTRRMALVKCAAEATDHRRDEARLRAGAGRALITPPVGIPDGRLEQRAPRAVLRQRHGPHGDGARRDRRQHAARSPSSTCASLTDAPGGRDAPGDRARRWGCRRRAVRVTATHNHSAPSPGSSRARGWMREGLDAVEPYMAMVTEQLAGAARDGLGALEPVTVGHGTGTSPLAVNRRADMPGGGVRVGHNWDGPVDHSVRVARLDGASGAPVATIVHYSAHPTILAGGNHYVTPEYPGPARRTVEESLGGHCLFLQGTPGDIGTVETFVDELEPYRRLGAMLGHDAAAVASRSTGRLRRQRLAQEHDPSSWLARFEYEPQPPSDETLRVASRIVMMPVRPDLGDPVALRREATARRAELRAAIERRADALRDPRAPRADEGSLHERRAGGGPRRAGRTTRSRSTGSGSGRSASSASRWSRSSSSAGRSSPRRRSRRPSCPATRTATATTCRPIDRVAARRLRGRHLRVPPRGGDVAGRDRVLAARGARRVSRLR